MGTFSLQEPRCPGRSRDRVGPIFVPDEPCRGDTQLATILNVGVPVLVFSTMLVLGMELTADDFRRVARQPATIVAATLGQFVVLPAIGWLLVRCLELQPGIGRGVLLVAACPSGSMANLYTRLAGANVALSVTLTAVSCLAAVLTTPLALAALGAQLGESAVFPVPFATLAGQLVLLLVVPVLAGMGIRRRWPAVARRRAPVLIGVNLGGLAVLLGFIIVHQAENFAGAMTEIAGAAVVLTVLAFLAGYGVGWLCRRGSDDRFTLGMVFVVRNAAIATAVAVTALGQLEFAVFATAYFFSQLPLLVAAVVLFRFLRGVPLHVVQGVEGL
jgi:BASS family bile acid:Na+ symporter